MELSPVDYKNIPNKCEHLFFLKCLIDFLFPNFYNEVKDRDALLDKTKDMFLSIICNDMKKRDDFFSSLGCIYEEILDDIEMTFDSDPAANSHEEILISYPGINAIMTYRIAHRLYELDEKVSARILTEYAHSKTGIDIHPGATIGNHFFIDHGTGIVIGETTVIGNYVRIYQGVTLGALSLSDGHALKGNKRHPTIGNNVIIYANASILGGDTVIGDNVTIGGNVFITKSIPSNVTVISKEPELVLKNK